MPEALLDVMRADVEASTHPNFKLYPPGVFWARALGKLLLAPNVRAVLWFRVAHAFASKPLLYPLALWLRGRIQRSSGADIHPRATIGPGLFIVHSSGVVIGPEVVVGARCRLHQGVTLGEPVHVGGGVWRAPRIGDDVTLGAHAVVLGDITVGDRAVVGANAVVTSDVAPRTVVAGVPAKVIREIPADERA